MLGAEVFGLLSAPSAQFCLQAAGRVVDSRVNDATVTARLMSSESSFFFLDEEACARALLEKFHGRRETDDAAADDAIIPGHTWFP